MKRYIFLTANIHPIGGMQNYVAGKAAYLEKNGWKVTVFFWGDNKDVYKRQILYGHKKMDERYLLLLLFVISRSIIESEHLTLVYSWFPALLGMAMFDSQKTKTEMRV